MKQYDSYKPSLSGWFSVLPAHWNETKIKYFCLDVINGATPSTSNDRYWDGDIAWIASGKCHDCIINSESKFITKEGYDNSSTRLIPKNTALVALTGATCAQSGFLTIPSCTNQSIVAYINHPKKMDSKFIFYMIQGNRQQYLIHQTGGAQAGINVEDCKNIISPIPPLAEQTAIAEYLDKKCVSIDRVIATQERRIERLGELKQSIITEAVTRGINPNVPLKDSGIEWIGKIPEHWDLIQLKFAANKANCCFIDGDWIESTDISEEGIRYITTGNVGVLEYKEQGNSFISEDTFERLNCTEVFPGDILISRLNEPIGRSCILPDLGIRVVTSVDNVIFRPNKDLYDKRFLVYYLNCSIFTEHANLEARGSTMHRMSRTMLGHQQTIVPPIAEQTAIAEYLDRKCARIDAAIAKAKREVELLREFKQSVITEAVTGKIKVCKSQHLQL